MEPFQRVALLRLTHNSLVSAQVGLRFQFELWATQAAANSYVAVAISEDQHMVRHALSLSLSPRGMP